MDGIFLIICWGNWIITTFILDKKHPRRFHISLLSLLLIIFAHDQMLIGAYSISVTYLILVFQSFYFVINLSLKEKGYLFITSLMVTMLYTGIYLLELYERAVFKTDGRWYIFVAIMVVIQLVYPVKSHLGKKFLALSVGLLQGDWLIAVILHSVSFPYKIGGLPFLDFYIFHLGAILIMHWLGNLIRSLDIKSFAAKEKQKSYE
ncbi:hypothetical protein J2S13_000103 [Oikeobacillus pervagus]|uniref:Uncharacterized protein n=1 Tax=Oikeobacillus pervagus TaxID=1325931 RepID=A0AAJ1SW75_9BACI|nr:hypothetical protein [Oikeobacillus pervagus]MDQ0213709.1 hypothetical protein [Oikeobacillus pervagus]